MKMIDRRQQFQTQFQQQQRIDFEYYNNQFNYRFQDQRQSYINNKSLSSRVSIDDKNQHVHLVQVENEYEYYTQEKNILYQLDNDQNEDID